ncbi:DNA polymerase III subunit gamma/tau [Spirochaeta africana]|uniref:DNA polymerase III subunit gamma/tau n=1 Tax=Spirochaeta africana (strain ATCC 700263 / DSM 8902 / Z-7692) TaxID=889378 RepID=H9UMZ3_SPIAZ|nr:DNA polymerase III subunit gamma/tau [Spirochaeta africana]AFG38886.1 DNA polymerase III, subunit gamma/tau [Spirochaeta africana DSM 8902]
MAYEVTATRKRPTTLDGLIGQEFVVATLKNSIQDGRIAHAYLFSGPRGVGKTSAARILARALNCPEGPNADTDTRHEAESITRGTALDVIEIDGASNTSVNDVREIKDEVLFPPNHSRYKIYIIDEVHMLSTSAFNALLKTIEEPPPYIIFIFATTELHKVPATIKSRCQQFHFRLIPLEQLLQKLIEAVEEMRIHADRDALMWIAKEGRGSLRDAYTLFDQVVAFSDGHITLDKIKTKLGLVGLDRLNSLAEALADGSLQRVMELSDQIMATGVSVDQFVIDMNEYFRNLLLLRAGIKRESVIGYPIAEFSSLAVEAWSEHQLMHGLDLLLEAFRRLRYTVNERFELELVLGELCRLRDYIDPGQLLNRIHDLRRRAEQGDFLQQDSPEPSGPGTEAKQANGAAGRAPVSAGTAERMAGQSAGQPARQSLDQSVQHAQQSAVQQPDQQQQAHSAPVDRQPAVQQPAQHRAAQSAPENSPARQQTQHMQAPTENAAAPTGEPAPAAAAPQPPAPEQAAAPTGDQAVEQSHADAAGKQPSTLSDWAGRSAGQQLPTAEPRGDERRVLDLGEFDRLIEEVSHASMSLGSALSGAISQTFDDRFLYLQFKSAFASKTIELESEQIEECIHTVLGVPLRVKVETIEDSNEDEQQHHPDPQVELPRKVFRGKVISG